MLSVQDLLLKTLGKTRPGSWTQELIQTFSKKFIGGYPNVIKLDINKDCNLNCEMCYAKNSHETVPINQIKEILDQVGRVPVRVDLLGGEPLLRPDICEIIHYAKQRTKINEVVLYTNGTLADKRLTKNLEAAGLDKAIVNLVSHDSQKHDQLTNLRGSWTRSVQGINNFKDTKIKTFTFTVVHRQNLNDIPDIFFFVHQHLGLTPLFYQYVPQKNPDPLMPTPQEWNTIKNYLIDHYAASHFDYIKQILTFCGHVCLGGYYVISVKTDGSVTPCPFMDDIIIGNVQKDNFWNIFASRLGNKEMRHFLALPQDCGPCSYKKLCGGGCRAMNRLKFGTYLSKDYRCLGPWSTPVTTEEISSKLPTYF